MTEAESHIKFFVSGVEHTVNVDDVTPETTLNMYLREISHLVGTKRMCLEGGCGSCLVAVEELIGDKKHIFSVNSCLVSILSCHGWKIHTIEGIGGPLQGYHPVQKTLAENNGTQCGFCSPGMVMNMFALYESGKATIQEIEEALGGNLCRCTGYRPILYAFRKLAIDQEGSVNDIEDIKACRNSKEHCTKSCVKCPNVNRKNYHFEFGGAKWVKVHFISDLLDVIATAGTKDYQLVGGNTARGVYYIKTPPSLYIDVTGVEELISYSVNDAAVILGGNVTLNKTIAVLSDISKAQNHFAYLKTIAEHISLIANLPIRNIATLSGNLMIKHMHNEFPSDLFLLLETFKATLVIVDVNDEEIFSTPENFLSLDMNQRVIKSIVLRPIDDSSYQYATYKIMPRAQNTHAMVNAGFLLQLDTEHIVESASIVFGNINEQFVHASATENLLKGKMLFNNNVLAQALECLYNEVKPKDSPPDTSPEHRRGLAVALFYKFVLNKCPEKLLSSSRLRSGGLKLDRPISSGKQQYGTQPENYPLGEPIIKLEAMAQTSGQAEYVADLPDLPNQLFGAMVTANASANSQIAAIDASTALSLKGVVAFLTHKDVPGTNTFMPKLMGYPVQEELFCSGRVQYYHQPVGLVVANSYLLALKAAGMIKVTYTAPTKKPYLNVTDVLKANDKSRIEHKTTIVPSRKGKDVKHVVKGKFYIKWQYHFHMEVQCCQVVPTEDGLDVFPSAQWMDLCQLAIAEALNMPTQKINVKVRRCGGGFGAKISRFSILSTATALAAYKLRKPVKVWTPIQTNINVFGKRFPFYLDYEVGTDDKGVIQYLNGNLYNDVGAGGNEMADSHLISMFENCYDISTWDFSTYMVKTDTHANTWCRAPGSLEGLSAIESVMDHLAAELQMDPTQVRLANTNKTKLPKMMNYWNDMSTWADIESRKNSINKFNKENRWKKKGLSIVPMAWTMETQANYSVMVSIFHGDGGVMVSHGGIEIGQGINTKAAQVCAYKLGIKVDQVSIKPSLNIIAANNTTTGNTLTSEAICYAVVKACDTLNERMKPIKDKMNNPSWADLVNKCFSSNIQLNATGFYSGDTPDIQMYKIYGLCATEVEVDILTGEKMIRRVDLIEDVGDSMSPLVDIGQVEGAFVMGIGYYTIEDIIFNDEGRMLTNRTWNYRVPGAKDIPVDFRVKFPEKNPNPVGVLRSKATGEPPMCLSFSVALAIRHAVASAREEADPTKSKWIPFDGPTTAEKIFLNSLNSYKLYKL